MATALSVLQRTKAATDFHRNSNGSFAHDDAVLFTQPVVRGDNRGGEITGLFDSSRWTIRPIWSGDGVPLSAGGQSVSCLTMWQLTLPEALIANLVLGKEMIVTLTATRPG